MYKHKYNAFSFFQIKKLKEPLSKLEQFCMTESLSSFTEFWIFEIPSLARPKLILKMSKQYMKLFTLQNIHMPLIQQLSVCEFPVIFDTQKYSL